MSAHSVEDIKHNSARLRGTLLESLANQVTGALNDDDQTLIKYHGSYQQDDRDVREERRQALLEPAYSFMIRTRTPGGLVSPRQWLKLDAIATTYAERGLRITTRQAFQFHGVIKTELKSTMQAINAALIDTLAACGDVNRNVAVAANPQVSASHAQVFAQAAALSEHLLPNTRAYYEIWLDEERVDGSGSEDEPIYGNAYLPRKFKIGFAIPPYNDVDVFAQDLGYIAIIEDGELLGYNVTIGGGMGATHGDAETYPRVADVIGFVTPDQVIDIGVAVVTAQRDFGNRAVRKRARLKYTIDDRGLEWFKAEVERRAGFPLLPARAFGFRHNGDRFGWIESDGDAGHGGIAHLTLRIPAGRIVDGALDGLGEAVTHLSGLREIAQLLDGHDGAEFRMTPNQNLVIAGVPAALRAQVDALVAQHGLDGHVRASTVRRNALACVALPTCGLAMAEAERYLPDFVGEVEKLLAKHAIPDASINLRISGCPNGCSRPYLGEIALVGKAPGRYNLMLGADHRGQRLNTLYRENIAEHEILAALDPLFAGYASERDGEEGFGDYLVRRDVVSVPYPTPTGIPVVLVTEAHA
ncbi:assimilatory sulfite reductase (NADPH) hemoprotein subunit [Lysobacter capsici]|uniref:assimilatory sulfite reductase (NADPH) hemoprotein subunit n=1 Tax=Lysobacter capsici TaxID=435897 RepID=UPI00287BBC28|nr:assimilatory sulfite reductase (NADPH) hemoprotein subunit [Lysobacter capsici]WND81944.1 assimilatory sulfite reductase (NADPH) hemoprotein subunit [Lysobacter capsici]WND87140.1 assimilatory sulfite reductase (NADPH) hemoprotein subunit [Lysobacter capsici]